MKAKFVSESLKEQYDENFDHNDEDSLLVNEKPFDDGENLPPEEEDVEAYVHDEFEQALRNELNVPDYSRRTVSFRVKGDPDAVIDAVPMARMKDGAYLMKVGNKYKKFDLNDIIEESFQV